MWGKSMQKVLRVDDVKVDVPLHYGRCRRPSRPWDTDPVVLTDVENTGRRRTTPKALELEDVLTEVAMEAEEALFYSDIGMSESESRVVTDWLATKFERVTLELFLRSFRKESEDLRRRSGLEGHDTISPDQHPEGRSVAKLILAQNQRIACIESAASRDHDEELEAASDDQGDDRRTEMSGFLAEVTEERSKIENTVHNFFQRLFGSGSRREDNLPELTLEPSNDIADHEDVSSEDGSVDEGVHSGFFV